MLERHPYSEVVLETTSVLFPAVDYSLDYYEKCVYCLVRSAEDRRMCELNINADSRRGVAPIGLALLVLGLIILALAFAVTFSMARSVR